MTFVRLFGPMLAMVLSVPALGDTVTLSRVGEIKRPLNEVKAIILAFDKACEANCLYTEAKLKEAKIFERTESSMVVWTDYAEILPTQTYKLVSINSESPSKTTISLAYPDAVELARLENKYGLIQKTQLDRDEQNYTLEEISSSDGSVATKVTVDGTFAGGLIKGYTVTIVKKNFNDRIDARFAMLATAPLPPSDVSYYGHIKPIIDAHCQGCHQAGGLAPFTLDSFAKVKAMSGAILESIDSRQMPPWNALPTPGHGLKYDFSLSNEKIQLFHDWVDAGFPLGDAANPGPAIVLESAQVTNPNLILGMEQPHTATAGAVDEYRCFPIGGPSDVEYFVTGFSSQSTNPRIVHHVALYAFDPEFADAVPAMDETDSEVGYSCFGAPNTQGFENVPSRLIGTGGYPSANFTYPATTGTRIRPGTRFVLQVHYSIKGVTNPSDLTDQTTLKLKTATQVEHDLATVFFTKIEWIEGGEMLIPAGNAEVIHSFTKDPAETEGVIAYKGQLDLSRGMFVRAIFPHQHLLGRGIRLSKVGLNGESELLFSNWDLYQFHFQWTYEFESPIWVAPGEQLRLDCKWDNSGGGSHHAGHNYKPVDTSWGEGTSDEMCVAVLSLTEG